MDEPVITANTTIDNATIIYLVIIGFLLLIIILIGIYILINPQRKMNNNDGDYLM